MQGDLRLVQAYVDSLITGGPFGFGLFFDPGTGKTDTALNFIRRLQAFHRRQLRVIVLGPPVVVPNWKEETKKFSDLDGRRVIPLLGTGAKRLERFQNLGFDHMGRPIPGIFILNYESMVGKQGSALDQLYNAVNRYKPELIFLDESQRIKNHSAKRTERVDILCNPSDPKIQRKVPRPGVVLLSGSPFVNSPMDIFTQFRCLDGGATFGVNFYEFRAKYFRDKNARMPSKKHFPDWVPKPGSMATLQALIAAKSMRALKEDCMDLPPLLKVPVYVDMGDKQRRLYNEMKRHLITYLESDACVAQLAVTKALRLMQIASGFIRTDEGVDVPLPENPKLDATRDLLEDLCPNHKVIVWAVYHENYRVLRETFNKLGFKYVEIHGGISATQKKINEDLFQKDPSVRGCIGHPKAGGIGINLPESDQSIRYSADFNFEDYLQSNGRNHRGGSEIHESVTQRNLILNDSLDEKVYLRLDEKKQIGVNLLRELIRS